MEDAEENKAKVAEITEKSTPIKKGEFLANLAQTCNITKSAELTGIDRSTVYLWRREDPQFDMDLEAAKAVGFEAMEDEMHRRAFEGTTRVNQSGVYREYSDTLAIFLSKAHKPDKYNERIRNEISGPGGAPLNLDDQKIAIKLDQILKAAQAKMNQATAAPEPQAAPDDFDDLC